MDIAKNLVPTVNCANQPVVYRAFKSENKARQFLFVVTGSVAKYRTFQLLLYVKCFPFVGLPVAPSNIMLTLQMATWIPLLSDLWYTVTVCRVDGTNCSSPVNCTGCSSRLIPGIVKDVMYNVTVCSFRVVNGVSCMETCTSITTGKCNSYVWT